MSVKITKEVFQLMSCHLAAGVLLESNALCFEKLGQERNAKLSRDNSNVEFFDALQLAKEHGIEIEGMKVREGGAA